MNLTLQSASNFAPIVDHLSVVLVGVCSFFVIVVLFLLIFFGIKYRAGTKADRSNPPTQWTKLELGVAFVILLFGFGTFVVSAKVYYGMYTPPNDARTVYVTAKQWMWKFQDMNGKNTINELTLPVNEPVRLVMTSEDVIHSLFVPAFRVKQDVLPGRYTSLWFTPTEVGDFLVLCTQYCGLSHSSMRATIHIVPKDAHAAP
jgi:cytochrome c oxidase subunit 2